MCRRACPIHRSVPSCPVPSFRDALHNLVQYHPVLHGFVHRARPVPSCPVCISFGIEVVIARAIVRPYSPRPPSFVLFVYYTVRGSRRSSSPPPPRRLHKSHYWKPRHASRKPPLSFQSNIVVTLIVGRELIHERHLDEAVITLYRHCLMLLLLNISFFSSNKCSKADKKRFLADVMVGS